MIVNMLGQWQEVEWSGQSIPVGGLVYYMSPPHSFSDIWEDPIHAMFYKMWIDVSGTSARDVAKQLKEQQMSMPGYR